MRTSTYIYAIDHGFEYGTVIVNQANRRKDKFAPIGIALTYEQAQKELAKALSCNDPD